MDTLTQMPFFAARVVLVLAGSARTGIARPGVAGSTAVAVAVAVAAAARPPQLAVACIPPVALPHIVPVGRTGRMR